MIKQPSIFRALNSLSPNRRDVVRDAYDSNGVVWTAVISTEGMKDELDADLLGSVQFVTGTVLDRVDERGLYISELLWSTLEDLFSE
jgi:hypothetical protein